MATYWLKGGGEITYAAFTTKGRGELVDVLALIGASRYIDRTMSNNEARTIYKGLRDQGWQKVEQPKNMSIRRLQLLIYD